MLNLRLKVIAEVVIWELNQSFCHVLGATDKVHYPEKYIICGGAQLVSSRFAVAFK